MSIQDETETREGQRIAKAMARAGLCSRRDAERWIAEGRVAVNGVVLTSPAYNVNEADEVLVDGEPLRAAERTRLFMFHKPKGLVTTAHDPEGRPTVFDALPPDLPRVVTIGRLDINTEGLLLLTNDGGLARVLELPATGWLRRYRVRAHGEITQEQLDALREGVSIEGVDYRGIEAKFERQQGSNVWITMGLREGKNREIKRVLEHLGMSVNRLIRISFGPFELADLAEGEVAEVRTRVLRDQLGPKLAKQAGVDFDAPVEASAPAPEAPARREAAAPHDGPPRKRKHVSVLRAEATQEAAGPRRRVTRSATADRKGRAVAVERISLARPPAPGAAERRPARSRAAGEAAPLRAPRGEGPRKSFGDRPRAPRREGDAAPPRRDRPPRAAGEAAPYRAPRGEGPRKSFGDRPRAPRREGDSAPPRRDRPVRAAEEASPYRAPRGEGPRKDFGDRPRAPRREGDSAAPRRDRAPRAAGEAAPYRAPHGEGPRKSFGDRSRAPRREGDSAPPRRDRPPRAAGEAAPYRAPRGEDAAHKPYVDRPRAPRREGDSAAPRRDRAPRAAGETAPYRAPHGEGPRKSFGDRSRAPRGDRDSAAPRRDRAPRAAGEAAPYRAPRGEGATGPRQRTGDGANRRPRAEGPSGGPSRGPNRGPNRGPSRGASRGPDKGPRGPGGKGPRPPGGKGPRGSRGG